ncbi:GNAT family N-acetyltransferase [Streptomyces buecherae]|uniref:GNAT family N-acetyltransferase n=1 Tax=Streptomyces buecherae TaxID=2763006 RepID=A0A7H8N9T2_9ACTN|nr:GNAT family protein [Streptomyces buecherae]QKW51289.1 GNAT family N-acetyltransferase [Streptomyces buecherae]
MYPITRHSSRLALRELTIDDVDAVHAIYGSPEATEHMSFTPRSRGQVDLIVARWIASASATPREEYALAATARHSGEPIGCVRLANDPHQPSAATFGFALRPDAWGVGYGREVVRLICDLAFTELGLHRLWAARSPHNIASERTLLAAGLTEEGRIRAHVHVRGAWRDSITYSILREEWESGQADASTA